MADRGRTKPLFPRLLMRHLDPLYFKTGKPQRIERILNLCDDDLVSDLERRRARLHLDRRCGIDRRNCQQPVLMDTRSPHARRKQRQRRRKDAVNTEQDSIGIDVYG